jgi:hypothetical protein
MVAPAVPAVPLLPMLPDRAVLPLLWPSGEFIPLVVVEEDG